MRAPDAAGGLTPPAGAPGAAAPKTTFAVLGAISFCHALNDMMQSLLPAIYPVLKSTFGLGFAEVGLITLVNQATASLLQPVVGYATDRRPQPYSLTAGMAFTFGGLVLLATARAFPVILLAAALVGVGSSVFHPESSRIARLASGGRHGLAQSLFQVGGNAGSSLGPLLAAFVVVPRGRGSIGWFSLVALLAMAVLFTVGRWYARVREERRARPVHHAASHGLSPAKVRLAIAVLLALVFSKHVYLASLTSYYMFYLVSRFGVSVPRAQLMLFAFLGAVAAGTLVGGPVGDRFGRKRVIWFSILGVLPFSLALPYASLFWTGVLSVVIGLVLASAFSAIVVYAQELVPGRVGMIAGLFFGLAFGFGGLGAAALGRLADLTSIGTVYRVCAFLPALGILTALLPDLRAARLDRGR